MKEIIKEKKTACFPGRGKRSLSYGLLEEDGHWGIFIRIEETGETAWVRDITTDGMKLEAFLHTLAEGLVTPVTLQDLVYDFLCQ